MHRPRHQHTAIAMRASAALLVIGGAFLICALGVLVYTLIDLKRDLLWGALGLFVFSFGFLLGYWIMAKSARCSLCMGQILLSQPHARSTKVTRLFGSYRLRVARDIILTNAFRCPYCGEPTRVEAKELPPEPVKEPERPAGPQNPDSW